MKQFLLLNIVASSCAFTIPPVPPHHARTIHAAVQVDDIEKVTTNQGNDDLFVLEDFEEQLDDWTAEMETINQTLVDPDVPKDYIDAETGEETALVEEVILNADVITEQAESLISETETVAVLVENEEDHSARSDVIDVDALEQQETTTVKPFQLVDGSILRQSKKNWGLPIQEISVAGVDRLESMQAQFATAQRAVNCLATENRNLKQQLGLLYSTPTHSKRPFQRLLNVFSQSSDLEAEGRESRLLELANHEIETDTVLRLSNMLATAQRTMQSLNDENRDLKSNYHSLGHRVNIVKMVDSEKVAEEKAPSFDTSHANTKTKTKKGRLSIIFRGAASVASKPFQKKVEALNENIDEEP